MLGKPVDNHYIVRRTCHQLLIKPATKDPCVAAQVRSRMATKHGRSNGSFQMLYAKDVDGSGQASTPACLILESSYQL